MRDSHDADALEFEHGIDTEFFLTFAGGFIASGVYRTVYRCRIDDSLVIKIEKSGGLFCNVNEWKMWELAQYDPISKWLAPCVAISPRGTVLLQKRTTPASKFPAKIPIQLGDTHRGNYGMLGSRFVCHDYGGGRTTLLGNQSRRMHKVKWRD